jgi:hypothetical protein
MLTAENDLSDCALGRRSMSERELTWRIMRLRFDERDGVWHAVGVRNGRIARILLPPSVKGEAEDRWLERIDQAFEEAASTAPFAR